jgi:hemerythrin superfamily protein
VTKDVVDLIMADHREVESLFERMKNDRSQRPMLVPVMSTLLVAHSRAEEAEVYPVARDEAGIADDVAHSQQEHAEAEALLEQLKTLDHESEKFHEVLDELIDAVTHHVEEEESSVLPGMRKNLPADRLAELGEAFMDARAEHMGDRPGEATRQELLTQAENADVSGRSAMDKTELKAAVKQADD